MLQYVIFSYEDGVYKQIDDRRFFSEDQAQFVAVAYRATAKGEAIRDGVERSVLVLKLDNPIPSEDELIPVHKFSGGIEETHYYPKELMPSVCYWSTRDLWQWIYREGHDECITGLEGREELTKIIEACITEM